MKSILTNTLLVAGLLLLTSCPRLRYFTVQAAQEDIVVEAEDFDRFPIGEIRNWYNNQWTPEGLQDADPDHGEGAVGSYLEILPDTRQTHADPLIHGENFSNKPGVLGVLEYPIFFKTPGRYYVWVRAYYTGTEDNGLHVGIDGEWPASGQRMQWCGQPNQWHWESKQRTEEEHCGVERQIYLDVPTAGKHIVQFSMREDGFEFDRFLLSMRYQRPKGQGPVKSKLNHSARLPD